MPPLLPSPASYGIPFAVVCCVLFGEFLCAGVGGPFMFFMLADMGLAPGQVGLWVGIVSSTFFLAQFVTSLLWARLAARHGRRVVLAGSLLGSALATVAFGASSSLPSVLLARFAQGVFNGAVGVARATVVDIIHPSQEAHAYALLGVCWSLGGSVGPVLGGVLEHPVQKFPWAFDATSLYLQYPYLLPCVVASVIPAGGALMCLFIGPDGGPRTGAIALPVEKDSLRRVGDRLILGAHSARRSAASALGSLLPEYATTTGPIALPTDASAGPSEPSSSRAPLGSAYGYHAAAQASRPPTEPPSARPARKPSVAERFLLANDSMSLVDLWVAAALGGERERDAPAEDDLPGLDDDADDSLLSDDMLDYRHAQAGDADAVLLDPDQPFGDALAATRAQEERGPLPLPPLHFTAAHPAASRSKRRHPLPPLFRRSGVRTASPAPSSPAPGMPRAAEDAAGAKVPYLVIGLYSLLALHSSSFDQVFGVFLVTPFEDGGLGLTAAHFAVLIAIMAICQVVLQYRFYPRVGPPTGRLTHASMLRLGMALYFPCYALFPLLRPLGGVLPNGWGEILVMPGMVGISAVRYLANVSAFTSITILINAMSPPHLVPLANGLAQTATSAARCLGPILGGLLWAQSVSPTPDAHAWPFNYQAAFWQVGLLALLGAVASWFIR